MVADQHKDGTTGDGVASTGVDKTSAASGESVVRKVDSAPAEPVRLIGAIGPMLLKRVSPVALLGLAAIWLRHHRRRARV
jgi:hypothetical protein